MQFAPSKLEIVAIISGLVSSIFFAIGQIIIGAGLVIIAAAFYIYSSMQGQSPPEEQPPPNNKPEQPQIDYEHYIETAVSYWKRKGQADTYIETLDLPKSIKSKILIKASLRHKGRPPKNNPFEEQTQ